jgi:putative flippase GtrA
MMLPAPKRLKSSASRILKLSQTRYVVVGLANTLTGLSIIYALKYFGGVGDIPANAIGYAVGFLQSFVLNKSWTFNFTGPILPALSRYVLVLATAYLANLTTVVSLIALGIDDYIAQALGVLPYTLIGFVGSKHFAFASSSTPNIHKPETHPC